MAESREELVQALEKAREEEDAARTECNEARIIHYAAHDRFSEKLEAMHAAQDALQ
jgi:hypothetical protein